MSSCDLHLGVILVILLILIAVLVYRSPAYAARRRLRRTVRALSAAGKACLTHSAVPAEAVAGIVSSAERVVATPHISSAALYWQLSGSDDLYLQAARSYEAQKDGRLDEFARQLRHLVHDVHRLGVAIGYE